MTAPSLFQLSPGSAIFSPCGRYRYSLRRTWDLGEGVATFIMLNPSTATAEVDDPTIRRCIRFARDWGYAGLEVVNLFAYRATKPLDLLAAPAPVGPENDDRIRAAVERSALTVCAWGAFPLARERALQLAWLFATFPVCCLGTTKDGYPRHPLYVPADTRPVPWLVKKESAC